MQKTLVTQGKISNRRDSVRLEGRPPRPPSSPSAEFYHKWSKGLSQNDLEKSIEAAPLFTAKLKADRLKTQKTAHEN